MDSDRTSAASRPVRSGVGHRVWCTPSPTEIRPRIARRVAVRRHVRHVSPCLARDALRTRDPPL